MSTIKSSAENLTLNADGANNDIKFQSNGSEVASIDQAGSVIAAGTISSTGNTTITNGNIVFATAGKGIDFSANSNASGMTSELLDSYEEGAWTPVFSGASTAGTYSYAVQTGRYTKIGHQVTLQCALFNINDDSGAGAGDIRITGIPFTPSSAAHRGYIGALELDQFTFSGSLSVTIVSDDSCVRLRDSITGTADDVLQVADRNNDTSDMCFQISYVTQD